MPRNNMAQEKEIKPDSNETAVSEGSYLPIVCDVEVISHCWVFCCQGVNLCKEKRGIVTWSMQDLSYMQIFGFFSFASFYCCSLLLFSHHIFPHKDVP